MPAQFYIVDGIFFDLEDKSELTGIFLNETFRLQEKIWFGKGKIPLLKKHLLVLKKQIQQLNLSVPDFLINENEIHRVSSRLINKNKAFKNGIIELLVIWHNTQSTTIITCTPLKSGFLELKTNGLLVSFADDIKHSLNQLNPYVFYNSTLWKSIKHKSETTKFDGHIILNEKQEVTEFPEANIFFINENILFTPSLNTGCFVDQLRGKILEAAISLNFKIIETPKLNKKVVLQMEEAFIAGESVAMQKIMGIDNKRYTHKKTKLINKQLNRLLLI
jgi:branched-chain amino acid aminotransferase